MQCRQNKFSIFDSLIYICDSSEHFWPGQMFLTGFSKTRFRICQLRYLARTELDSVLINNALCRLSIEEVAFKVVNPTNVFFSEIDIRNFIIPCVHAQGDVNIRLLLRRNLAYIDLVVFDVIFLQ